MKNGCLNGWASIAIGINVEFSVNKALVVDWRITSEFKYVQKMGNMSEKNTFAVCES